MNVVKLIVVCVLLYPGATSMIRNTFSWKWIERSEELICRVSTSTLLDNSGRSDFSFFFFFHYYYYYYFLFFIFFIFFFFFFDEVLLRKQNAASHGGVYCMNMYEIKTSEQNLGYILLVCKIGLVKSNSVNFRLPSCRICRIGHL